MSRRHLTPDSHQTPATSSKSRNHTAGFESNSRGRRLTEMRVGELGEAGEPNGQPLRASDSGRGAARSLAHVGAFGLRAVRGIILFIVRAALWTGFTAVGVAFNAWCSVALLLLLAPDSLWAYASLAVGTAMSGCIGGGLIGFGQVMSLRRWLNGAASLGSFLSSVLASCAALCSATIAGWLAYRAAGDLTGMLSGIVVYGAVFGYIQRPMLDYLARRSSLWVPVNVAAALLGALTMLAMFDVSGGRRDTLQFRYVGVAYALVTGIACFWLTREAHRLVISSRPAERVSFQSYPSASPKHPTHATVSNSDTGDIAQNAVYDPGNPHQDSDVLEINEHHIYRTYRLLRARHGSKGSQSARSSDGPNNSGTQPDLLGEEDRPDTIEGTFRVLP